MDIPQNIIKAYLAVYNESASEHPDVAGQPEFARRVEEILKRRKTTRTPKAKAVKKAVAFFDKSVIKKKVEESACGCDAEETPPIKKDKKNKVMDAREIPTKVNLIKTKLRLMGLRMSYEPEGELVEENKSGDESLRDWFSKSSGTNPKTGKKVKGWAQLGGPFAGAPCARQPGQTSTPKCGSSKMAGNLSDKEEEKAFKRKNREDSNQPQKKNATSPTNVRTEEVELQEKEGKKDACYSKVKSRYSVWPSAYASGALVKCRKVGAANWGTKSEETIVEKEMTDKEVKAEKKLKSKYDDSGMKASMIQQYGPEKGKQVYFATIRKQAMEEALELDEAKLPRGQKKKINIEKDEKRTRGGPRYDSKGKPLPEISKSVKLSDLDDAALKASKSKVKVVNPSGKTTEHLSSHDFATHKLPKGHHYDFKGKGSFNDAGMLTGTSGNRDVITHMQPGHRRSNPRRINPTSAVTARGKMSNYNDDKSKSGNQMMVQHLRNVGMLGLGAPGGGKLHLTGNMPRNISGLKRKAIAAASIIKNRLKSGQGISSTDTYDDIPSQAHSMAQAAHKESPSSRTRAFVPRVVQSKPGRKIKGKSKKGDIVPVRLGSETKPFSPGKMGIRDNPDAPKNIKQTQRARKKARKGMSESEYYASNNTFFSEINFISMAPNKKGEIMSRSYQATKEDFELIYDYILEQLILEGLAEDYDSAAELTEEFDDELLEDLMREAITAIGAPAPEPKRPEKKGSRKLKPIYGGGNRKLPPKKEYHAEDFTPYEFWMNIIETQQTEETEEVVEEEVEEIVEEGPITSYQKWKQYLEEAPYTGRPVGRDAMISNNIARASRPTPTLTPTSTSSTPTSGPGALEKLGSSVGAKVGGFIGSNRGSSTGIPGAGTIGRLIGSNKGSTIGGGLGKIADRVVSGASTPKPKPTSGGTSTRPGDGKPYKEGPLWNGGGGVPKSKPKPTSGGTSTRPGDGKPYADGPLW